MHTIIFLQKASWHLYNHFMSELSAHHGQTDCSAFELFASLVHRKTIVSNRWIKESLLAGTTLDMVSIFTLDTATGFRFLNEIILICNAQYSGTYVYHFCYALTLQENFLVTKIHRYGEICQESNYQEFKFELRGDRWVDITKGLSF